MNNIIIESPPNTKCPVNGADAIIRGLIEAHATSLAGFVEPPLTEIFEKAEVAKAQLTIPKFIDRSINEKIAFEIALSGSMCKARTAFITTHNGLNVAADSLMTGFYAGALGGFVVIFIDDSNIEISKNGQDSRFYAVHGLVPLWEPSSIQEIKEHIKVAFDFSERFQSIVLIRIPLSLLKAQSELMLGAIAQPLNSFQFDEGQRARWTHLPGNARVNRGKILERLRVISMFADDFEINFEKGAEKGPVGVITAGSLINDTQLAIAALGAQDKIAILHLGMSFPLPQKKIIAFLKTHEAVLVLEDLEPIMEEAVKEIAFNNSIKTRIVGKSPFTKKYNFTPEDIQKNIAELLKQRSIPMKAPFSKKNGETSAKMESAADLILKACISVEKSIQITAIHCFDGELSDLSSSTQYDLYIGRGAALGIANGVAKFDSRPIVSILSTKTFVHSGLQALINSIYNNNDVIAIIVESLGDDYPVSVKTMVESLGLTEDHIWFAKLQTNENTEMQQVLKAAYSTKGVKVVITQEEA